MGQHANTAYGGFYSGLTLLVITLVSLVAGIRPANAAQDVLHQYLSHHAGRFKEELREFIAFPTVSALPDHYPDIRACAEWVQRRLLLAGMQQAAVVDTPGPHPIVYAHWFHDVAVDPSHPAHDAMLEGGSGQSALEASVRAAQMAHDHTSPDIPTVIIYGHYDVQPVDPVDEWQSPPFTLTEPGDGYMYGRGVDDDKGGVLQAIQAVEALLDSALTPPRLNIKLFIEGQEEILSPHLSEFLDSVKATPLLRADAVLSADGGQPSVRQGGIALGFRGVMGLEVRVDTATTDMHSGGRGGSVANPCSVLSGLLAGLHDPTTGRVTVPGFYEGVPIISEPDRQAVREFTWDPASEAAALGINTWWGEQGYSPLEQRWFRPTLEVVGMVGGFTGAGVKTVIPRTASAKITCRLVGQQDPSDLLNKITGHLVAAAPPHANVTVTPLGGNSHAWISSRDLWTNHVAGQLLTELHDGTPPQWYYSGATIPALSLLQSKLGLQTTVYGWGLGERIHAPNERVLEVQWSRGRIAWARLLQELSTYRVPSGSQAGTQVTTGSSKTQPIKHEEL